MLFWLFLLVGVIFSVPMLVWDDYYGELRGVIGNLSSVISIGSSFIAACMLFLIILENSNSAGLKIKYETWHDSLVYQLEEVVYDNVIDNNRKELMDDIQFYNISVKKGKYYQHHFWFGPFYADIYDDLEIIDLK